MSTKQGDLWDQDLSRLERDLGEARVLGKAGRAGFVDRVTAHVSTMAGETVTGEDIRRRCERAGLEAHHPNAWGATISLLVRAGILRATGEYRPMLAVRSHARRTPVYLVKGGQRGG